MVKKLQKDTATKPTHAQLRSSVKDSAQQIWQAGLGAFTRAQAEGSKAFESLVKEGVSIFEERVAKALNKLGVPSAKDVNALIARIDELNKAVQKLSAKAPPVAQAAPKRAASLAKTAQPKA